MKKDGEVSSHITYQDHTAPPQWFPPMTTNDLSEKFQALIVKRIVFEAAPEDLPVKIFFLTQKFADWFDRFMATLYRKEVAEKYVVHILDIKNTLEMLPTFIQELKQNPNDFLGVCEGKDFLEDKSKILGICESGLLVLQVEDKLIGVRLNELLGANFVGIPTPYQGKNALDEVYQSLGLPQYLEQEIFGNKYLENLFSNEQVDEKTLEKFKALTQK
jgi:hypothetical protein